jgi:hypothetical protein
MNTHFFAILIVILFLVGILFALGSGLYYLSKDRGQDKKRLVKALTWRISLSLLLFVLLFILFFMGWLSPHAIS